MIKECPPRPPKVYTIPDREICEYIIADNYTYGKSTLGKKK